MIKQLTDYNGCQLFKNTIDKSESAYSFGIRAEYWYIGKYGESEHYFSLKECMSAIDHE